MSDFTALTTADLGDGEMRAADGPDGKLLVARVGDEYFVTQEHCPHLNANLAKGTLDGTVVICPLHKSRFDLRDGACKQWTFFKGVVAQANEAVLHPKSLQAYEARVEDGQVMVGPAKPLAEACPPT